MATPNMNLSLPTVTTTPGPAWASQLNAAFGIVDGHNHSSGSGVQIPSSGININGDLSFGNFNATNFRSLRLNNQGAALALPNDLACIYSVNGDLYWNSGAGIPIQLTIGGALNATSIGGIGGDYVTSGASVSYSSLNQTFTFWQSSGVSALMDIGTIKLHPIGVSFYTQIQAYPTLAANYTWTLPSANPASLSALMVDNTGAMSYQVISAPQGEHSWELNGAYPGLSFPLTNIDSVFIAPYAVTITNVMIYAGSNGSSGITEFDLLYKATPSASWTSMFGANTGKIASVTTLANGSITTAGASAPYTVTVSLAGHGFVAGDSVTIAGATPAAYNGTWTVATATTNSFTFSIGTTQGSNTGGTIATRSLVYTDSGSVIAAQVGVTKPVVAITSLPAGAIVRWDLLQSMNTGATDARIRMFYNKT